MVSALIRNAYLLVGLAIASLALCVCIAALHVWGSYRQSFVIAEMADRVLKLERECLSHDRGDDPVGERLRREASGQTRERGE